jgi:uncharacterized protein (DUF2252 family)
MVFIILDPGGEAVKGAAGNRRGGMCMKIADFRFCLIANEFFDMFRNVSKKLARYGLLCAV